MTSSQKFSIYDRDTGINRLFAYIDLPITAVANVMVSQQLIYDRAFDGVPTVVGSNIPTPGMFLNAIPSATIVTVYAHGVSDFARAAETIQCTVTLEGRLA